MSGLSHAVEVEGRNPSYPSRPLDRSREIRLESRIGNTKRYTCCERVPILSRLSDLHTRSVAEECTSPVGSHAAARLDHRR